VNDEVPEANPPLSAEERSVIAGLTDADIETIDGAILANSSSRWLKVARVVGDTEEALEGRYPGVSYIFYAQRLRYLAEQRRLESQGNLEYMRFSEVRLPQ
jgi:hypothetical protein